MKSLDALNILNDLSASQQGVFTSAQARSLGIERLVLSRLETHGQIERIAHGVYRSCAAPSFREGDVWAAWLALYPRAPAWERRRDGSQGAASHGTAAWLLQLGELNPAPMTFTLPIRKQTRRDSVRLVKAPLHPKEVTTIKGIPTTIPTRTILDLLRDGEDLSIIANVLNDARKTYREVEERAFADKVDELGGRYGLEKGRSLYERLGGSK